MTSDLYRLLNKDKISPFQKRWSSGRSPTDWSKYTRFRNHCTSQVRSAKLLCIQRKQEEISSAADGNHHWWTLAKKLAKISTPRATIPELHENETVATNNADKANLLADVFAQQCTTTTTNEDLPSAPLPLPPNQAVYDFPSISELTVFRTLQHLPGNKSTAHPLLTNLALEECAPFLTHLCPTSSTSRSQQASSLLCGNRQLRSISSRTEVRQRIHLSTDRSITVQVGSTCSEHKAISSGVP